jgi:hypothetical protein
MTRLPSLILSAILLAGLAIAGESDPCAVKLHVTLHSYDGPVEIADACVTATTYTGDLLNVEARDDSGLVFRGDFEVWP